MRSVIKFLAYEGILACDIHQKLLPAYGPGVMNLQKVAKLARAFRKGRTNEHYEKRSGRPSLVSDGFVQNTTYKYVHTYVAYGKIRVCEI